MIQSFEHKGLKKLYETGNTSGVRQDHVRRLKRILASLDAAKVAKDMDIPGYDWHPLTRDKAGYDSVSVNGNFRVWFKFVDGHAYVINYGDYH